MNGAAQSTVGDLVAATMRWIHQPFTQPMSLWDLFLVVGAVLVFAMLWARVLAHVGE